MEPIGDVTVPEELDPVSLGFMCGLEIHQQLATDKLHSRMPSELFEYRRTRFPMMGVLLAGSEHTRKGAIQTLLPDSSKGGTDFRIRPVT